MPGQSLERLGHQAASRRQVAPPLGELRPEVGEVGSAEGRMDGEAVEAVFGVAVGQPVEEREMPLSKVTRAPLAAPVG